MHAAWRTLIHIGMAAWRSITKTPSPSAHKIDTFKAIWMHTQAFGSFSDRPAWNLIPSDVYLPLNLATRPSTSSPTLRVTSIDPTPTSTQYEQEESESTQTQPNPWIHRALPLIGEAPIDLAAPNRSWNRALSKSSDITDNEHPTDNERRRDAEIQAENILRTIMQEIENRPPTENDALPEDDCEMTLLFQSIYQLLED